MHSHTVSNRTDHPLTRVRHDNDTRSQTNTERRFAFVSRLRSVTAAAIGLGCRNRTERPTRADYLAAASKGEKPGPVVLAERVEIRGPGGWDGLMEIRQIEAAERQAVSMPVQAYAF
jgi:hypothetical protein